MDKNYEERFQQLKSNYNHEVCLYNTMVDNCNGRIADIDRKIAKLNAKKQKIEQEKKELKYPHFLECLLPQVINLLNEAVAERGYQFENKEHRSFGVGFETPVFQDYAKSEKVTSAYFAFRPCYDKDGTRGFAVKKKPGEYPCDTSIAALNDLGAEMHPVTSFQMLLDHIDECEKRDPAKQFTEDELIGIMQKDLLKFRCSPQPLWTYRTVTAAMKVAKEKGLHFEDAERIPVDMVDKEMFELGLEAGVYFYHYLPEKKLEELGAYEEDFLAEKIRRHYTGVNDVPASRMTTGVLKKIIPGCGFWYAQEWAKKYQNVIDQEVADLLIKETTLTFEYIPEEFRTFEMCQRIYKEGDKSMRKFIPSRFLTESGRMKKKPC